MKGPTLQRLAFGQHGLQTEPSCRARGIGRDGEHDQERAEADRDDMVAGQARFSW